ncbi:unannotated protein [freshwater metagenome]|uniref:Unannotated protein n=1 Tax=freshwater metagenome TaxID=449393 RepID=A0A6J6SQP2_9ZZZZ
MSLIDEGAHEPEQQGEEQGTNVLPVDVSIGHEDDLVVAQSVDVELVLHPRAEGRNECLDLVVLEHLVDSGLLHVEDLAADGQDGLAPGVSPLTCRATGRVTLDDEHLALLGVTA